jgi:hypothetical protein
MNHELANITYSIQTKEKQITVVVGLKEARQYISDNILGIVSGVAVRFQTTEQSEMLMSAKSFYLWGARLERHIYA